MGEKFGNRQHFLARTPISNMSSSYLVGVVKVHDPASRSTDILVALILPSHAECGVHVHVMAGKVQADQTLEDHTVSWFGRREEDKETGGRAAVRHHVKHGAKTSRLPELARCDPVQRIEEAGDGVEEAAAPGVERHEVEGAEGEDDAEVT